jgi:beta-lactamase superfamily II metal-dependent hydrolase
MATVFKKNLGANLHIVTAPRLSFDNNIEYIRSTYVGSDLNNSGYYIRIIYKQYVALMAGDIDYTYIAAADKININALAISHHGGKGSNNPPACSSALGYAVVSYGYDNSYHHPYDANIKEHHVVGWTVLSTAETSSLPRGDRWLY